MLLKMKPLSLALSGSALLVLSACGGGTSTEAPATPATLTGTVTVDQAIKNAVVCMDLNANNACDADEPASAKTGADGAYSLTYDPAKVTAAQAAGASLIAPMVPGAITDAATTLDAADPTTSSTDKAYVLKQVPGKGGQINPLTSLVAVGVAQGMAENVARANVATQLGIADSKIDNYQDDPSFNADQVQDNARMMAKITAAALEVGASLQVGDQTAAVSPAAGSLAKLHYTDAANYEVRTLDILGKSAGTGPVQIVDMRSGQTNSTAMVEGTLYTEVYLSSTGWVHCNAAAAVVGTLGNPSRSTYCNTQQSAGFTVSSDVAGQTMASVVTSMQADPSTNVINNALPTAPLLTALGTAAFPANAFIDQRTKLNLAQAIYVDSTDKPLAATITSLEQLIASKPSAAVKLATGGGTLGLGRADSQTSTLRVSFSGATSPIAGVAQFYRCDYNASQDSIANCVATQTGTYAISTVNGVRVLRYSGNAPTIMDHTRLHVEVAQGVPGLTDGPPTGPRVFMARENKATVAFNQSASNRLNSTAWAALKSKLGI